MVCVIGFQSANVCDVVASCLSILFQKYSRHAPTYSRTNCSCDCSPQASLISQPVSSRSFTSRCFFWLRSSRRQWRSCSAWSACGVTPCTWPSPSTSLNCFSNPRDRAHSYVRWWQICLSTVAWHVLRLSILYIPISACDYEKIKSFFDFLW